MEEASDVFRTRNRIREKSLLGSRPMVGQAAVYQESLSWQDTAILFETLDTLYSNK